MTNKKKEEFFEKFTEEIEFPEFLHDEYVQDNAAIVLNQKILADVAWDWIEAYGEQRFREGQEAQANQRRLDVGELVYISGEPNKIYRVLRQVPDFSFLYDIQHEDEPYVPDAPRSMLILFKP